MTQANQLKPNDPQPNTLFSLKSVSKSKLSAPGPFLTRTGFLPSVGLASTPHYSQVCGAQPHTCSFWMLQISGNVNCGLACNIPLSNSKFLFSFAEPITAFPGENFYFPGKIALLFVVSFCWHGLLNQRKVMCLLVQ